MREVVRAATFVHAPTRFNGYVEATLLPDETLEAHRCWLRCWEELRLEDLHGFPLWEREVFEIEKQRKRVQALEERHNHGIVNSLVHLLHDPLGSATSTARNSTEATGAAAASSSSIPASPTQASQSNAGSVASSSSGEPSAAPPAVPRLGSLDQLSQSLGLHRLQSLRTSANERLSAAAGELRCAGAASPSKTSNQQPQSLRLQILSRRERGSLSQWSVASLSDAHSAAVAKPRTATTAGPRTTNGTQSFQHSKEEMLVTSYLMDAAAPEGHP